MIKKDWIIILVGSLLSLVILIFQLIIPSQSNQVWIWVGVIAFVFVLLLILIISNKFSEFNNFVDEQQEINKRNEEKFKIYERLSNLEERINFLQNKK